jgi:hypothetical protein
MLLPGETYFAKFHHDFVSERHHILARKYNPNLLYWTDEVKLLKLQDTRCLGHRQDTFLKKGGTDAYSTARTGSLLNKQNRKLSEHP